MSIKQRIIKNDVGKEYKRYVVDYVDIKGKRNRKQFELRKDAEAYNAIVISKRNKGFITEANRTMKFEEASKDFMENHAKVYCKPSTADTYQIYLDTHINSYFGNIKVIDIKRKTIQDFISYLKNNTKLSDNSINKQVTLVNSILQKLVEDEILIQNPVRGIKKLAVEKKKMSALTIDELQKLLNVCQNYNKDFYPMLLTATSTGMRRGELLALKWCNIDLTNNKIRIEENLYGDKFVTPKTKTSKRTIIITPELTKTLKEWKLKSKSNKHDLVFANDIGEPMDARNMVRREFDTLVKFTGLSKMRWHDLRHTYASILIAKNIPIKFIQTQLGHSSIKTTMDTYGHLMDETCNKAIDMLSEVMHPEKGKDLKEAM